MARDYYELGPSPVEEDCLQMGVATNAECKAECVRYRELLERLLPVPESLHGAAWYGVKFFPYDSDAGGYYEAVIYFDDANEEAVNFVFDTVEPGLPLTWNDEPRC
jgi:hypothetical protein